MFKVTRVHSRRPKWYAVLVLAIVAAGGLRAERMDIEHLAGELRHPDANVKRKAAYAFKIGFAAAEDRSQYSQEEIDMAARALVEALRDRDHQVWAESVEAVAHLGPAADEAIPTLVDALKQRDRRSRRGRPQGEGQRAYRSAFALGKIGPAALPALVELLDGDSETAKGRAALALTWFGTKAAVAVPQLVEALGTESDLSREHTVAALASIGKPAVDAVAELLNDSSRSDTARAAATETLARIGSAAGRATAELASVAQGASGALRARAITALRLVGAGSDHLLPVLTAGLKSDEDAVRESAAVSFVKLIVGARDAENEYMSALLDVLTGEHAQAATEAAGVIRRLGDKIGGSSKAIVEALLNCSDPVAIGALSEGLGRVGNAVVGDLIGALADARCTGERADGVATALASVGAPAVPALQATLGNVNSRARVGAANALGRIGRPASAAARDLELLLADEEPSVRASSARALGAVVDPSKLPKKLPALLEDEAPAVRAAALGALVEVGYSAGKLLPAAMRSLDDESVAVRVEAARAVASIGSSGSAAAGVLVKQLNADDLELKRAVARALGAIGPAAAKAVEPLAEVVCRTGDAELYEAAVRAIGNTGAAAGVVVPVLDRELQRTDVDAASQKVVVEACARIGTAASSVRLTLEKLLSSADVQVKVATTHALVATAKERRDIVATLVAALGDDSPAVRRGAMEALGECGRLAQDAVPRLFEFLDREYERSAAFAAIERIGPESVDFLTRGLKHSDRRVRAFCASRLGELGAKAAGARGPLKEIVDERKHHWRLRQRAKESLEKIEREVEKENAKKLEGEAKRVRELLDF